MTIDDLEREWHESRDECASLRAELEQLEESAAYGRESRDECVHLHEEIKDLELACDEAWRVANRLEDECCELQSQLFLTLESYEALETVKYWLHDALVLGKPLSDPAVILRKVEEALE